MIGHFSLKEYRNEFDKYKKGVEGVRQASWVIVHIMVQCDMDKDEREEIGKSHNRNLLSQYNDINLEHGCHTAFFHTHPKSSLVSIGLKSAQALHTHLPNLSVHPCANFSVITY